LEDGGGGAEKLLENPKVGPNLTVWSRREKVLEPSMARLRKNSIFSNLWCNHYPHLIVGLLGRNGTITPDARPSGFFQCAVSTVQSSILALFRELKTELWSNCSSKRIHFVLCERMAAKLTV